jgi:hypothetical protein
LFDERLLLLRQMQHIPSFMKLAPLQQRRLTGSFLYRGRSAISCDMQRMSGKHLRVQQGDRRWESGRPDSKLLQCHTPTA